MRGKWGHADKELQAGADCSGATADRSADGEREDCAPSLQRSRNPHPDLLPVAEEYEGLKLDQAKRLKALEKENARLKRLVAELSLEKQVLGDVAQGNF